MNKTIITAKILSNGTVVQVLDDGLELPFSDMPLRCMTDEEVSLAANADVDALPMTQEQLQSMRRISRVKTMRKVLGITQEEFSARYHVPIETLRNWEQGKTEPDESIKAYLTIIAHDPEGVYRALQQHQLTDE